MTSIVRKFNKMYRQNLRKRPLPFKYDRGLPPFDPYSHRYPPHPKVIKKPKFKKINLWPFLIISFICSLAYITLADIEISAVYANTTELPKKGSVPLTIILPENSTLYIERVDNESQFDIKYPSEVFFNQSEINLWFNYTILDEFVTNSTLESFFELTSDAHNNTYNYSIIAQITYNEPPLYETEDQFFLNILNGQFYINITTDLLPKSGSLNYELAGSYNTTINITCPKDSWLTCPDTQRFGADNKSKFSVSYTIPLDASSGVYNQTLIFETGNVTKASIVTFEVRLPDLILKPYEFTEECFQESDSGDMLVTYDCILKQEEHNNRRLSQLINSMRKEAENCSCPEPEEVYIIQGNIDESTWQYYVSCKSDLEAKRKEYTQCNDQRKTCNANLENKQTEYEKCSKKLLNNESTCLENTFATAVEYKRTADEVKEAADKARKSAYWKVFWILLVVFIMIAITVLYAWYLKTHNDEVMFY